LLAPPVAASALSGFECGKQSLGKRAPGCLEGACHVLRNLFTCEDVSLDRVVMTDDMTRPFGAPSAGMACGSPGCVDNAQLADFRAGVL